MLAENFPSDDYLDHSKVVFNTDELTCQMAHVFPSEAIEVEGNDFIVHVRNDCVWSYYISMQIRPYFECNPQPVVASMKMIAGTLASVREGIEAMNAGNRTDHFKLINVDFCPGVVIDSDVACQEEWIENLTSLILSSVYPSEISESYYFTSQAYLESDFTTASNQTSRSLFWKDILERFQKDETCNEVFENRLVYSFARFGANPWGEVRFNATGVVDHDVGCVLTLLLAISTLSNVCAAEVVKNPKPLDADSQWTMQTGTPGDTPFFDVNVGLDGEGQVVAVSDTGIDPDNCYFWDVNNERSEVRTTLNHVCISYLVCRMPSMSHLLYPSQRKLI